MNKLCFLLFFISSLGFSQNLEEDIYVATETFISNQTNDSFIVLCEKEKGFKKKIQSKNEHLAFVFLLCNKGFYLKNPNPILSITSYEDAWSRYNKHELSKLSDYDIIENCLKPLGNLYTKNGDYTNAENIINQYIFLAEKSKNTNQLIAGAINLSRLYQAFGKHDDVFKITSKYINTPNINNLQKQKLIAIHIDSQIATKEITSASEIIKPIKPQTLEFHKTNYLIELQNKKYQEAKVHFFKAKEILLSQKELIARDVAKIYFEEAQLHYLLKNIEQTKTSLAQAIKTLLPNFNGTSFPEKEMLYAENTFIDIFDLLAILQSNTKDALKSYNLSSHVSSLLYGNLTSQKSKTENTARQRIRGEKCIELLFTEYLNTKNETSFIDALTYAENTKGLILKDAFNQKTLLEQFPNDSLLIKEQFLLQKHEHITNSLINERLSGLKATVVYTLSKQLNSISIQLKLLKQTITKKYPKKENHVFNLTHLQQKLKQDNATLVEYFYGEKAIYQFIISPNTSAFNKIDLNPITINEIIDFNHLFDNASTINNNILNFTERAFGMYTLLHFNEASTTKNVIIIPDGILKFTPFDALIASKTTTLKYSEMPFLINNQMVLYNSSLYYYLERNTPFETPNVLGVFPVFNGTSQKLTYSLNEAKYLENEVSSTILLNEKASKHNFIKNAANYNTLHLSTHATAGSISFYESTLSLNELYALNLNTDLVVLSACETGVGTLFKSEGAMSMARGFQFIGAKNVLFTLWQINDLSTSQIMQSFYENYSNHQSGYIANHQSKIEYLENNTISNIKKSPYYWSSFVYYGTLQPAKTNNTIFYILFGVIILLIVLLLFFKLKKHGKNASRIPNKQRLH